ncbi:zinc finger MYM-type protein 1-like [Scomber scombrus]|uniref:Zinc finger MYM-type protein 1-like n=1 Tax=Scomber scombrus TaxID=13677 RepID=A0AAV1N2V9_SCOSC
MASGLNGVQNRVKDTVPQALFVHCYALTLNLVMSQGASKIKECKIFFANLGGLSAFFTRSPKRTKLLDEFCQRRLPRVTPVRWNFNTRLVCTVHEKRAELVDLFQHILDQAEDFDRETVHCASGHLAQLKSFDFCFFLFSFTGIFDIADVLFGILQSKTLDMQFCLARIADCVEREREKFNEIFDKTAQAAGQPSALCRKTDVHAHYRQLHAAVVDNILAQIRNRFEDHKRLMFVGLLDSAQFQKFKLTFPEAELGSLMESYGTEFDLNRLKVELKVMYNMHSHA